MKIRRLNIKQFRSHVDTTIDFNRITVIRAPNAAGKTSLQQAVEIALSGRTDGTSSDGKGSVGLIRAGFNRADIRIEAEIGDEARLIECALKDTARNVVVTNPADPSWQGMTATIDWLKKQRDVLSCLINNRFFVDLGEDAQKDILSAIILPPTHEWPEWVIPMANSFGLKIDWKETPFEIIKAAYRQAYDARTAINRDVKNFKVPEGDTSTAGEAEEIKAKVEQRREELQKLLTQQAQERSVYDAAERVREAAQTRYNEAHGRIVREEANITALDQRLLSAGVLKERKKIAANLKKATELDQEITRLGAEVRLKKQAVDAADEFAKNPACPTCGQELSIELQQAILKPLLDAYNEVAGTENGTIAARKALGDPAGAQREVDEHERAAKDMEAAKARVKEDQVVMKDAENKLDQMGAPKEFVPNAELDGQIEDLRERIKRGEEVLRESIQAEQLKKQQETAKATQAKLLTSQKNIERLVKYFDEEARAELLATTVGAFSDQMNAVLAKWGYTCRLSIEPYVFSVVFKNSDNKAFDIPLKHLSMSERYRFSAAFQIALAIVSGFRFVVVDAADIYDPEGKGGLFEALENEELDQAIVLATDVRLEIPPNADAVFYRFENVSAAGVVPTTKVRRLSA